MIGLNVLITLNMFETIASVTLVYTSVLCSKRVSVDTMTILNCYSLIEVYFTYIQLLHCF